MMHEDEIMVSEIFRLGCDVKGGGDIQACAVRRAGVRLVKLGTDGDGGYGEIWLTPERARLLAHWLLSVTVAYAAPATQPTALSAGPNGFGGGVEG